jgi:hypothetical protein
MQFGDNQSSDPNDFVVGRATHRFLFDVAGGGSFGIPSHLYFNYRKLEYYGGGGSTDMDAGRQPACVLRVTNEELKYGHEGTQTVIIEQTYHTITDGVMVEYDI